MTCEPWKKALVIGPAWVGDMVMAQVLFQVLHQRHPGLVLDVLAPPATAPLLGLMPEVRQAWPLQVGHGELGLSQRWALGRSLRSESYDACLVLPRSWKSALVPWLARIPRRIGWKGEFRYGLLLDRRQRPPKTQPMVQALASLAFPAGTAVPTVLPFPHLAVSREAAQSTRKSLGLCSEQRRIVALCPGSAFGPAKQWPARHFATIARWAQSQGFVVWLLGGPGDQGQAQAIVELAPESLQLCGKTSLVQAVHLLSLAAAVVSNDSGLLHVAAALGRPLVALYGSSTPDYTPPLCPEKQVRTLFLNLDCRPCFQRACPLGHLRCLEELAPGAVQSALEELFHQS